MRGFALVGVVVLAAGLGAAVGSVYEASAADQTQAAPAGVPGGLGGPVEWGHGPEMTHHADWMGGHGGPGGWHHHEMDREMFGLFAPEADKNLTPANVKLIAQAILLEHGAHEWSVTNVTQSADAIDFSYATAHGDVVATFAVDPKTGHMKRVS